MLRIPGSDILGIGPDLLSLILTVELSLLLSRSALMLNLLTIVNVLRRNKGLYELVRYS